MNRKIAFVVILILATNLLSLSFADSIKKTITVYSNQVNIQINGKKISGDNFAYNNTTYAPLKEIATMLGSKVEWDSKTNTAIVNEAIPKGRVKDSDALGLWQVVTEVQAISDFKPEAKHSDESIWIKDILFENKGKVTLNGEDSDFFIWGDGVIFYGVGTEGHVGDDKACYSFYIKEINGEKYLFLFYKTGAYFRDKEAIHIYVYKKVI